MTAVVIHFPSMEKPAANRIREFRKARGWSLVKLGEQLNMSGPHVYNLEVGEKNFTLAHMRRFAAVFGVAPADLLLDDDHRPRDGGREQLGRLYDSADEAQRRQLVRVAEATIGYNAPDEAAARKAG